LTFTDANALDTHTAVFAARAGGYVGSFSLNTSAINTHDKIGWSFSVSDSAIDYLAAGQTLTQYYDVTVNDGRGGTAMQTVTVKLTGTGDTDSTNGTPIAFDDVYSVGKNARLGISPGAGLLANDVDADSTRLKAILVSRPDHGTLHLRTDGGFYYRPDKNYVGVDSFTYKTSDGKNVSDVAKVWIGVGTSVVLGAGLSEDGDHDSGHGDHGFPDQIPMLFAEPDSQGLLGVAGPLGQLSFMVG
jgi:VCBS repeat-containing protein